MSEPNFIAIVRQNNAAPDGQSINTTTAKSFGAETSLATVWLWYQKLTGSYTVSSEISLVPDSTD